MRAWFRNLFRSPTVQEAVSPAQQELASALDAAQRSARAVAKLGLLLDQIESKIEGGFADLRTQVAASGDSGVEANGLPFELLFYAAEILKALKRGAEAATGETASPCWGSAATAASRGRHTGAGFRLSPE